MFSTLPLYYWFEFAAFVTSIFTVMKAASPIRYFVPYLFFIVLFEYGSWHDWFTIRGTTLWSINIVIIIEFSFYSYIMYAASKTSNLKRFIIAGAVFSLLITAINMLFIQKFWKLNSYSYLLMSLFQIVAVWMYFVYLLKNETIENELIVYNPYFWISAGIMFFYSVGFVFFSFFEYMAYNQDYTYYNLSKAISTASIIILYTCLVIAFLCFKLVQK